MTLVSPSQSSPGEEINASDINGPVNQIASVVNGNLDDTNVASLSGTKITAGTLPASAMNTAANVETRFDEAINDFVASGCVWSATSGLDAAMTAGVAYVDGKRVVVSAVASRTFTASRDTYVSVNSSGTISYSEVTAGATPPSLPANSIWLACVITSASAVTAVDEMSATSGATNVLARRKLGSSRDAITIAVPAKRFLKISMIALNTGGAINAAMNFNGDTATNYALRESANGGADTTNASFGSIRLDAGSADMPFFSEMDVINIATQEKLVIGHTTVRGTAGAANTPFRKEFASKWANTSAQITRITVTNAGAGDFAADSEIVVIGWD